MLGKLAVAECRSTGYIVEYPPIGISYITILPNVVRGCVVPAYVVMGIDLIFIDYQDTTVFSQLLAAGLCPGIEFVSLPPVRHDRAIQRHCGFQRSRSIGQSCLTQ